MNEMSRVTRVDVAPLLPTRCDKRCGGERGPTSLSTHIHRELKRVATAWGSDEYGWSARFDRQRGTAIVSAYVGRYTSIIAVAEHQDVRVGLARLLGSLFELDGR